MDLANIINTKRSVINFSWNGSIESFEKYEKTLLDGIFKEQLSWIHDDSFPINLKFQLNFVKFNENLVLSTGIPSCCSHIAFVHIYFLSVATVEEYRSTLPEFAEWFAQIKTTSWLVVFDSTRAREQKARGHILEKIKSDVSGFQNRIFETNGSTDSKAIAALISSIKSNLITSFDNYSNALKSVLLTLKDDKAISDLINSQFNLSYFYWSLGMTENALNGFDNLESTINSIFSETASSLDEKSCAALNALKSIDGRDEYPSLEYHMRKNETTNGNSLISLRAFVMAHQMLAGLFSYEIRRKNGDSLTLNSLNNFFASSLFGTLYKLLVWLKSNVFIEGSVYDQIYQQCFIIVWTYEVFEFSKTYDNFMELETTREDASKLQMMNSEAWLYLHSQNIGRINWLDSWIQKQDKCDKGLLSQLSDIKSNNCGERCIESFKKTVSVLKSSKWSRNFVIFRLKLSKLMIKTDDKSDIVDAVQEMLDNNVLPISFIYSLIKQQVGDPIEMLQSSPNLLSKFNSHISNAVLTSNATSKHRNNNAIKMFNFDVERFPFRLLSIYPPFIVVRVNKPFCFNVNIHSNYEVLLDDCEIGAVFKPFDSKFVHFTAPAFESIMQENHIARLQCVKEGQNVAKIEKQIKQTSLYSKDENDLECVFVRKQSRLSIGPNLLEFESTPFTSLNYSLSHVYIKHPSQFEFILSVEYEKIRSKIGGCLCFAEIKSPNVELIKDTKSKLYAGIVQEITLCLHSGSVSTPNKSRLRAYFVEGAEFLNENGSWSEELQHELSELEAMGKCLLKIRFCTIINQINFSSTEDFSFVKNLRIEWQGREWTFELKFVSILSIKTMTSILEDKTLFEMEIQRCDGNNRLLILPLEAKMESIDEGEEENVLPADLLNDCLEPIYADSTYRLIWKLAHLTSNAPVNHRLNIKYKIDPNEDSNFTDDEMEKVICSREYLFKNTISFAITPVEYEICARILSEKPQSVICRADTTCDFVISLRKLTKNKAETVIVALEVDPDQWTLIDKYKVVNVKENGLGQTSFNVVPAVGYLPYPAVYLHRVNENTERDLTTLNESKLFGERIVVFNRSEAKQIHVLSAFNQTEDTDSLNSSSSGIKSLGAQAKLKLQRLFD